MNGGTNKGSFAFARGGCIDVEEGHSHLRERLLHIQVSLSLILGRNEKVEQHIKKKTHKPNVFKFWVEGGVIILYGSGSVLILVKFFQCFPSQIFPTNHIEHLFPEFSVLKEKN